LDAFPTYSLTYGSIHGGVVSIYQDR